MVGRRGSLQPTEPAPEPGCASCERLEKEPGTEDGEHRCGGVADAALWQSLAELPADEDRERRSSDHASRRAQHDAAAEPTAANKSAIELWDHDPHIRSMPR